MIQKLYFFIYHHLYDGKGQRIGSYFKVPVLWNSVTHGNSLYTKVQDKGQLYLWFCETPVALDMFFWRHSYVSYWKDVLVYVFFKKGLSRVGIAFVIFITFSTKTLLAAVVSCLLTILVRMTKELMQYTGFCRRDFFVCMKHMNPAKRLCFIWSWVTLPWMCFGYMLLLNQLGWVSGSFFFLFTQCFAKCMYLY
jgi:hypothetical protein